MVVLLTAFLLRWLPWKFPLHSPPTQKADETLSSKLLEQALELYRQMKEAKLQPSTDTLNAMIIACSKARRPPLAASSEDRQRSSDGAF